jgi:hypothetical protein
MFNHVFGFLKRMRMRDEAPSFKVEGASFKEESPNATPPTRQWHPKKGPTKKGCKTHRVNPPYLGKAAQMLRAARLRQLGKAAV